MLQNPHPKSYATKIRTKNASLNFSGGRPLAISVPGVSVPGGMRNTYECGMQGKALLQEVRRRDRKRGECLAEGTGLMTNYSPETAVAAQDVAPGLPDQHAVHRQHMQPHLKQNILQPTS